MSHGAHSNPELASDADAPLAPSAGYAHVVNMSGGGEPAVACTDLLECLIITIERGWFCIRNRAGWLLWSAKKSEVDLHRGIVMSDLAPELSKRQAEWQRDHDEAQADHSNDGGER